MVLSGRDIPLGYIGANRCGWIRRKIDRGPPISIIVDRITGDVDGRSFGLVLAST